MSELKLTKKEQAWLERFKKTMAAAPDSLHEKIWAHTIGDNDITLYNRGKFISHFENNPSDEGYNDDHCTLVEKAEAEIAVIRFPFPVESTAG